MSVHWVVDRSLGRSNGFGQGGEAGYENLIAVLNHTETPYTLVRKIPFAGTLIDPDDKSRNPREIKLDLSGPVFVCGTLSMRITAKEYGWTPGYIDAPDYPELIAHWGEHMLNSDAVVGPISEIVPPQGKFFARPIDDSKSFAGTIYETSEWEDWCKSVMGLQTSAASIQPNDIVMLAPLKKIFAEYRLYVIGGRIVTGSRYKLGSRVFYTTDLDPAMLDYARERIREYCPRDALCLDIAHIDDDDPYRIIETNAISSAGFYACDMNMFVQSINAIYG